MIADAPSRLAGAKERIESLRLRDLQVSELIGRAMVAGSDTSVLRAERREIREETEDQAALAARLEADIRARVALLRLTIAKALPGPEALRGQLAALHAERTALFAEGEGLARGKASAPGFADKLAGIEKEIARIATEIEEADAEIEIPRAELRALGVDR